MGDTGSSGGPVLYYLIVTDIKPMAEGGRQLDVYPPTIFPGTMSGINITSDFFKYNKIPRY